MKKVYRKVVGDEIRYSHTFETIIDDTNTYNDFNFYQLISPKDVQSNKKNNKFDKNTPNTAATVDTTVVVVDTGAIRTTEDYGRQQNAKYKYLSEYYGAYRTYKQNNSGGTSFEYIFNFDQGLKITILGQDPIFTNQATIIDYGLNLNARLTSTRINYNLGNIDKEFFKKKMGDKLISAGWEKGLNDNYFKNRVNQNEIYLNEYGLILYYH